MKMINVFLGLGSNLGDRKHQLEMAINYLESHKSIEVIEKSSIYETKPFGFTDQPDFLNMVIRINTYLSPEQLLKYINEVEEELKRKREIRWGPRTIDIDILLYDEIIIKNKYLQIPHQYITERLFVLIPLAEIYNGLIPGKSLTIREYIRLLTEQEGEVIKWKG